LADEDYTIGDDPHEHDPDETDTDIEEPPLKYADGAARWPEHPPQVSFDNGANTCANPLYDTPVAPGEIRVFPYRNSSRASKVSIYLALLLLFLEGLSLISSPLAG